MAAEACLHFTILPPPPKKTWRWSCAPASSEPNAQDTACRGKRQLGILQGVKVNFAPGGPDRSINTVRPWKESGLLYFEDIISEIRERVWFGVDTCVLLNAFKKGKKQTNRGTIRCDWNMQTLSCPWNIFVNEPRQMSSLPSRPRPTLSLSSFG